MTNQQRQLLNACVQVMQKKALPHGSMHPLWDMIFSAELIMKGEEKAFWPFDSVDDFIYAAYCEARK